ncbi:Docking protein 1 Downstream of tyrosine kinase 1 [Channa argus]|uniref:Docking protein 1 Downstream of tyrosine kinase 1 n=1 Tax=Channa argus TaxID=215402 RepID=A0A6G1P9Y4_CHAAH|nr:Docking protein 1 Downstream of tyrosine kinase 1 [Channa argus]
MDTQTKTGKVYLQPRKAGKKWKPVWLSLFPHSSSAVGRLEIQDVGGGGAGGDYGTVVRRHHLSHGDKKVKIVRLSELISVLRLPPNAEACPMENMSAFCVETHDGIMVFAALKDECVEWVEKLCHCTFQKGHGSRSTQLHMEENQIYASTDAASEFWVVVQKTEAATRCGLQGSYWLQVGPEALLLREQQKKNIVQEWPYELLRRYGKDELTLTIEAGRRCESGPGTFIFETQQAEKVFSFIQSTIKRKTSTVTLGSQNQTNRAHSPLPKIPDKIGLVAFVENNSPIHEKKCAASDEGEHLQGDQISQSDCVSAHPAPITLMPLPSVPRINSLFGSHHSEPSDVIYSNPAECIQSVPVLHKTTSLYVDPASVLPLKPPTSREAATPTPSSSTLHPCFNIDHPDSGYSEVYDKISPVQNKKIFESLGKTKCFAEGEPIYSEPLHKREELIHKIETNSDPFAHLYAQVCKTGPSSSASTSSCANTLSSATVTATTTTTKNTKQPLGDVIYENLGTI